MDLCYEQYFGLIRFAINPKLQVFPDENDIDWHGLFEFCIKQSIAGVVFEGVIRLSNRGVKPPFSLLLEWIALSEQIRVRNGLFNDECSRLTGLFEKEGHNTAILKGQANARLYPNPLSRHAGDIDIYVDGGEKKVIKTLYRLGLIKDINIGEYEEKGSASKVYHHIHLPTNEKGVDVEVHFRPSSGVWSPFSTKKIQLFLKEELDKGCEMTDEGFRVPTLRFALVMQMAHLQRHFICEGIGLRQVIDYYYLLKTGATFKDENLSGILKQLGLAKFAGALMWVLKNMLGLEEDCMIVTADEKRGNILLREIIRGGNFGSYFVTGRQNGLERLVWGRKRHLKLLSFDFKESFWYEINYWSTQAIKSIIRIRRGKWNV